MSASNPFLRRRLITAAAFAVSGASLLAAGHELSKSDAYAPKVAMASDEGERAIRTFKVAPGFKTELVAAEPHLANPVAFTIDEKGRFYVAETFRHSDGVLDIRGFMQWLDEELACKTVADREAFMQKHYAAKKEQFSKESERVKLLWSTRPDGVVDKSTVFSEGYNNWLDGIGAGLLARKGDVWFTCMPALYHLRDDNGDGVAEKKQVSSYGYGVRNAFLGHDLHGLRIGPDGKLYFTCGDRGFSVKQGDKLVAEPERGAVLRCNLDGSELEVFHRGLRNPQELAFDEHGNLFTGDNNSDGGDPARWVYCVEGGDSGWHVGWQFIEKPNSRGPWNDEKLCRPETTGLWHLPAIANIAAGPSGLAHYSGVGLPASYNGTFFLADFRGGPGSVIHMIQMKPKGATFEVTKRDQLATGFLVTDVEMGNDGSIYALDWVQGWNKTGKGRIYKFTETNYTDHALATETKTLIAEGMDKRPVSELVKLLGHADQRVRQEAQFSLVDKKATKELTAALKGDKQLPRIHAIWGLGMLARKDNAAVAPLVALLKDKDTEVRAQAAKILGDAKYAKATDALIAAVKDIDAPRAQFFAAIALGKIGDKKALPAIVDMVRAGGDQDAYLRHASVSALLGIAGDAKSLVQIGKDDSSAVRTAALVAMRRKGYSEVGMFLTDREPKLVTEAARAINDEQITGALPALAKLLDAKEAKPLARRSLAANLRVGSPDNAKAVVHYAMNDSSIDQVRVEALQHIANWSKPSGRDAVTGLWRPITERDGSAAADAIRPVINELLKSGPAQVQIAAAQAAEAHKIKEAGPALFALATTPGGEPQVRVAALKALAAIGDDKAGEAIELASKDSNEAVRKAATTLQAASGKGDATTALAAILGKGSIGEQQNALTALSNLPEGKADDILAQWMEKLLAGQLKSELALDLIEAAAKRKSATVAGPLKKYEDGLSAAGPLDKYSWAMAGGNAAEGKKVFWEKAEASCLRCHKVNGEGGEVGPELGKVAATHPREYLLESIAYPNKHIAQGYETLVVTLKNGQVYAGILKKETDAELEINSPEDGMLKLKKADVKERERGLSGMPEGLADVIGRRDLRDVVEYLSTLK